MTIRKKRKFDINKVPFVPAYDLLDGEAADLSSEEVAAIALSLYLSLDNPLPNDRNVWSLSANIEAITQRL